MSVSSTGLAAAFAVAKNTAPRSATIAFPLLVHSYDRSSQDPDEHAIIGTRLDTPDDGRAIRVTLGQDRRTAPTNPRPGIFYFAVDPATQGKRGLSDPNHKCYTPPGGVILVERAYPARNSPTDYIAGWLSHMSRGPDDDAFIRVGFLSLTSLKPATPTAKASQSVHLFDTDQARIVSTRDALDHELRSILALDTFVGKCGFFVRLHQAGVEGASAKDVFIVYDRLIEGRYVTPTTEEAITTFRKLEIGAALWGTADYGKDRVEIIPVSRVQIGYREIEKAGSRPLDVGFRVNRDDPGSVAITRGVVRLYQTRNEAGELTGVIAARAAPLARGPFFTIHNLPTQHYSGAPERVAGPDDDLPDAF
jgi:hypothetical protein